MRITHLKKAILPFVSIGLHIMDVLRNRRGLWPFPGKWAWHNFKIQKLPKSAQKAINTRFFHLPIIFVNYFKSQSFKNYSDFLKKVNPTFCFYRGTLSIGLHIMDVLRNGRGLWPFSGRWAWPSFGHYGHITRGSYTNQSCF